MTSGNACYVLMSGYDSWHRSQAKQILPFSPAVLLSCNMSTDTVSLILPELRDEEQNRVLAEVARAAGEAWRQLGHPGWYAAQQEGQPLMDLFRHLVYLLVIERAIVPASPTPPARPATPSWQASSEGSACALSWLLPSIAVAKMPLCTFLPVCTCFL